MVSMKTRQLSGCASDACAFSPDSCSFWWVSAEVLDELRTREALHAEALHKENGERRCSAVSASSFPSSSSLSLRGGGEGCLSEIEATDKAAEDEEKQRFSNATSSTSRLCVGRGGAREGDWESAGCHYTWKLSGWHPEYGSHMIEAIPGKPYPLDLNSLFYLLPSMQIRRKKVQVRLGLLLDFLHACLSAHGTSFGRPVRVYTLIRSRYVNGNALRRRWVIEVMQRRRGKKAASYTGGGQQVRGTVA